MSYIRVKNVGKAYRQYHSKTGRLIEWLSPLNTKRHNLKWILSDINFEVAPGEAVGIIGINGAGKSTLLKLITGTSRPTTGEIGKSQAVSLPYSNWVWGFILISLADRTFICQDNCWGYPLRKLLS